MKEITLKSYKKQIGDIPKDLLIIVALVFFIWATLIIYKLGGLFWLVLVFFVPALALLALLSIWHCYWRTKKFDIV